MLVRKVSGGGGGGSTMSRKRSRTAVKGTPIVSIVRQPKMKPNGEYKMTRCANLYMPYENGGWRIGTAFYVGIGLVFFPGSIQLVTSTTGQSVTSYIANYAELAAVWDRVQIEKVFIEVSNKTTDPSGSVSTAISTPVIFYARDNTDVINNTLAITQQHGDCKSWHANSNLPDLNFTVYPSYQRIVYYNALLSSYEPTRGHVVSDTEIPHYGVRMAYDTTGVGSGGLMFRFTYHYSCKNVK